MSVTTKTLTFSVISGMLLTLIWNYIDHSSVVYATTAKVGSLLDPFNAVVDANWSPTAAETVRRLTGSDKKSPARLSPWPMGKMFCNQQCHGRST